MAGMRLKLQKYRDKIYVVNSDLESVKKEHA